MEYELLRRKIETQARELVYFTGDQMRKFAEKLSEDDKPKWAQVVDRFSDQSRSVFTFARDTLELLCSYRVLVASIRNLTEVDGHQAWRENEHESLSKLMQARLTSLQNPSQPCTEVKRTTCNINKGCGYGCEIHHAMHCFHISYALGRPLILLSGILSSERKSWKMDPLFPCVLFCRWMEIQSRWIRSDLRANEHQLY